MIGWIEKIASEFREKPKPRSIPASLFSDGQPMGFPDESLPFDLLVSESHSLHATITMKLSDTNYFNKQDSLKSQNKKDKNLVYY